MTLTLIDGNAQQAYEEHPVEVARRALMAAADLESPDWAARFRRVAAALPHRGGPVAVGRDVTRSDRAAKTRETAIVLSELESLLSVRDPLKQAVGHLSLALKQRDRRVG